MSRASDSSTADLRGALERLIGRRLHGLERRPYAYRTSFALEELALVFDDGSTLSLIFKDLGRHSLDEQARLAKPAFLYDPLREIEVYRDLLGEEHFGPPRYYGAVAEPKLDRFWLFVEKISGRELWQIGELETWRETTRWLANFHERLRGSRSRHLLRYDADFYRLWLSRARQFRREPLLERIAGGYDDVVERLMALPKSLIHGEFYASNVLVSSTNGGLRVSPVDWEMAAVGAALIDLAALTVGRWSDAERETLALAYRSQLEEAPAEDEFLAALDCCRLHLALQWLGWSPNWTPPSQHAHDWMTEANRLADKLGL